MTLKNLSVLIICDSFSPNASGGAAARYLCECLIKEGALVSIASVDTFDVSTIKFQEKELNVFPMKSFRPLSGLKHLIAPRYIKDFRTFLKQNKVDIVHFSPLGYNKSSYLIKEARLAGVKIVAQFWLYDYFCARLFNSLNESRCDLCATGNFTFSLKYKCGSQKSRLVQLSSRIKLFKEMLQCDAYLSPTAAIDKSLLTSGIPPEKIIRMPVPFNADRLDLSNTLRCEDSYFVFYGQAKTIKGFHLLPQIARNCPSIKFKIFPSSLKNTTEQDIFSVLNNLSKLENVEVFEQSWSSGLSEQISRSMGVILPTLWPTSTEYALLEAMGLGKPVVTFNVGVHLEILRHEENAMIVQAGDIKSFSQAIIQLNQDINLRKKIGENARSTFEEFVDRKNIISALVQAYLK